MNDKQAQHYKEQSISTMTQEELLLLLYDEQVKRLTQAQLALEKKNFEVYESAIQRGMDIVQYLNDTLDHDYAISKDLARVYEYLSYQLIRAKIGRRSVILDDVKNKCAELRDTFREAQKKLASEKEK